MVKKIVFIFLITGCTARAMKHSPAYYQELVKKYSATTAILCARQKELRNIRAQLNSTEHRIINEICCLGSISCFAVSTLRWMQELDPTITLALAGLMCVTATCDEDCHEESDATPSTATTAAVTVWLQEREQILKNEENRLIAKLRRIDGQIQALVTR